MTHEVDALGNTAAFTYDDDGELISRTDVGCVQVVVEATASYEWLFRLANDSRYSQRCERSRPVKETRAQNPIVRFPRQALRCPCHARIQVLRKDFEQAGLPQQPQHLFIGLPSDMDWPCQRSLPKPPSIVTSVPPVRAQNDARFIHAYKQRAEGHTPPRPCVAAQLQASGLLSNHALTVVTEFTPEPPFGIAPNAHDPNVGLGRFRPTQLARRRDERILYPIVVTAGQQAAARGYTQFLGAPVKRQTVHDVESQSQTTLVINEQGIVWCIQDQRRRCSRSIPEIEVLVAPGQTAKG